MASFVTEKRPARRFWLFSFDDYYPDGGMCDVFGDFDTLAAACEVAPVRGIAKCDNCYIVDTATGLVFDAKGGPYDL